jgi:hypothetical protein
MNATIYKLGFWSALAAFIAAAAYSVVQILQVVGAARYPWDAIVIYVSSLCIVIPFLLAILALHYSVPDDKKIWSHAALLFTVMYAVYVTLNYVVQLATVLPMSLRGASEQVRVLDQTPHSLFWDVDALGYIFLGFATLVAVPVFAKQGVQQWARWFFLANGLFTAVIAFVYFYPQFSYGLLLIALPWVITVPGSMFLLALCFKSQLRADARASRTAFGTEKRATGSG